jgi:hypothetical protein
VGLVVQEGCGWDGGVAMRSDFVMVTFLFLVRSHYFLLYFEAWRPLGARSSEEQSSFPSMLQNLASNRLPLLSSIFSWYC